MTRSKPTQSAQSLDKVAVFAGLPAETLARIQKRCSWRHYEPGEPIVDYLDASNDVFFITAGEARVSIYSVAGKAVTFTDLGAGDMFGEYAAIDGARRSATIEARTACHVASMSATAFRELLHQEPAVMLALLNQFVSKIRTLTTRVYEFSALAVSNRIQAELLRLANLAPQEGIAPALRRRTDPFRDCQPHQHPPRGGHARTQSTGAARSHRAQRQCLGRQGRSTA